MNQSSTGMESMAVLEKIFQQCPIRDFSNLEVDLAVLYKELTQLADTCSKIESFTRRLAHSVQDTR